MSSSKIKQQVFVRSLPGDANINITFNLNGRSCELNRIKEEPLQKTLLRLSKNIAPTKTGKGKKDAKKAPPPPPEDLPTLYYGLDRQRPVPPELPNAAAWRHARLLVAAGQALEVVWNAPMVERLSLKNGLVLVGYPVLPLASLVNASTAPHVAPYALPEEPAAADKHGEAKGAGGLRDEGKDDPTGQNARERGDTIVRNVGISQSGEGNSNSSKEGSREGEGEEDLQLCVWSWFRLPKATGRRSPAPGAEVNPVLLQRSSGPAHPGATQDSGAPPSVFDALYVPTKDDEGHVLRVECMPYRVHGTHGALARFRDRRARASGGGKGEKAPEVDDVVEEGTDDVEVVYGAPSSLDIGPAQAVTPYTATAVRGAMLPPRHPDSFRIVSYNILADQYASTERAKKELFYYCPPPFLEADYRRQLVLDELAVYGGDVICLQEVDASAFYSFLEPHLRRRGYSGLFANKAGKVREGCATFVRDARFSVLGSRSVGLRDIFCRPPRDGSSSVDPRSGSAETEGKDGNNCLNSAAATATASSSFPSSAGAWHAAAAPFAPLIESNAELAHALQRVGTVAQVTLLEDRQKNQTLAVANTHLFFNPGAPHIRTMHVYGILTLLKDVVDEHHRSVRQGPAATGAGGSPRRPVVFFCGDLNSDLKDGMPGSLHLLKNGQLPADFWDWAIGASFKWGVEAAEEAAADGTDEPAAAADVDNAVLEAPQAEPGSNSGSKDGVLECPPVFGVDLVSPLGSLRSADDLATPFSNYTDTYKELLDYIWYEPERADVTALVPMPTGEELRGFLPNEHFPSDHLPVIADFRWRA